MQIIEKTKKNKRKIECRKKKKDELLQISVGRNPENELKDAILRGKEVN